LHGICFYPRFEAYTPFISQSTQPMKMRAESSVGVTLSAKDKAVIRSP
jgi:hypothetical protein